MSLQQATIVELVREISARVQANNEREKSKGKDGAYATILMHLLLPRDFPNLGEPPAEAYDPTQHSGDVSFQLLGGSSKGLRNALQSIATTMLEQQERMDFEDSLKN